MANHIATRTSWKPGVSPNPSGRPKGHADLKSKFLELSTKHADRLDKILANEDESTRNWLTAYQFCLERGMGKVGPEPEEPGIKTDANKMTHPEIIMAMQESIQKLLEENERLRKENEKD